MGPARVPRGLRPRLARQQRRVREDLAGCADQPALVAAPAPPLLLAVAEILGDDRRIHVGGRRQLAGGQGVEDPLVAPVADAGVQLAACGTPAPVSPARAP